MSQPLIELVNAIARRRGVRLAPNWASAAPADISLTQADALDRLNMALGWPAHVSISRRPRAHDFPLLVFDPAMGWGIAEQWKNNREMRVVTSNGMVSLAWRADMTLIRCGFPEDAGSEGAERALDIFWSAITSRRGMLRDATIATIVINIIALGTSLYSMQVYDRVIPRGGFSTLWVLTAGMIFALLLDYLIRNTRAMMVDREAGEIDNEISEFFFARMQSVRLDARPPGIGTMAAQLRGLEQVRSMMASASLFVLADLPFAFLFMGVMAMIGGMVVIVPLVTFGISILLSLIFSRLIREDTAQAQVTGNRKNGLLVEALDASETIKAYQGGWHMLALWNKLAEEVHGHDQQVRRWSTLAASTFALLQQIAYVGIVVWGAYRVNLHEMTMGGLIACTIIGGRVNGPLVAALPNLIIQWGYARSSLKALDAVLMMPSDHDPQSQPIQLPHARGELRLDGVGFAHPGARAGIEGVALTLKPGERVGIVGPVGSGKSTLLRLMAGLYAPQQGHVLLDGIDVRQIAEDDLRSHICYFPQDYRVVNGTLRDNLVLGLANPRDDVLMDAATKSGLVTLIQQHPQGLDMPIAEGGRGLSGGQRALVGLTRAILAKPRLLLLDEPTANLDQDSEVRVLNAIVQSIAPDATLILVTHKFQLLSLVQRLLVVANGQVALDGPTPVVLEKLSPRSPEKSAPVAHERQTATSS